MRVLQLVKTSTGAYWAWRQIRELVNLGVEVHVALPEDGGMAPRYAEVGAHVHFLQTDLPVRKPHTIPRTLRRLRNLVSEISPDLIHSHFVGTTLSMRSALGRDHRTPRLFQVPGPLHLEHPFFRRAEIASAGPADSWIGSCEWTCAAYRQAGIGADRVYLNYYGLAEELLVANDPMKLRREFELSEATPVIGMVGFMYPPKRYLGQRRGLKGHEDLIDAVSLLLPTFPDLRCFMVGGPYLGAQHFADRLRRYAVRKCGDRIVFLGTRTDVPDLYRGFNVAVHPSHSENLGGAGESLMIGVPTVATWVGGFPDIVRDGETGWIVPPKNPRALAAAISEALRNKARADRQVQNGRFLVRKLLDIRQNAADLVDIYDNAIQRGVPVRGGQR